MSKAASSLVLVLFFLGTSTAAAAAAGRDDELRQQQQHKRFSMNYQDLVEPNNPKSWRNTLPESGSAASAAAGGRNNKRFSMNFQDTISESDPRSWKNTMSNRQKGNGASKRFTMNYLDMVGDTDPRSWQNTMDSKSSRVVGRHVRRREELQSKRSRGLVAGGGGGGLGGVPVAAAVSSSSIPGVDPAGVRSPPGTRSLQLLEAIDAMVARVADTYGQEAVCANEVVSRLLRIKDVLAAKMPNYSGPRLDDLC